MTRCPNCQATLPDGAYFCQFCQTNFGAAPGGRMVSRRVSGLQPSSAMPGAPGWVLPAYYGIAVWWMFDGGWQVFRSLPLKDGFGVIGLIIGGVTAIVGLGLLARIDLVRGIVNILCLVQIIDGALGIIIGFLAIAVSPLGGAFMMIMAALQIALACLMIYLIGETDVGCRI